MRDPAGVDGGQGVGGLRAGVQGLVGLGEAPAEARGQGFAGEELRHGVHQRVPAGVLRLAEVVGGHDAGVVERRGGAGGVPEPPAQVAVRAGNGGQGDGDGPGEQFVVCPPHLCLAVPAGPALKAVAAVQAESWVHGTSPRARGVVAAHQYAARAGMDRSESRPF